MTAAIGEHQEQAPAALPPPVVALGPGFRFHPTDEELVRYYLKRKVLGKPLRFDCITEIDLYKFNPWDLPGFSCLKTRDLEWYFFTALDKKYGHGSKTNRSTGQGYWKTTGKDHPILHQSRTVGMRKALVYHSGRAPHGQRTNWVMHEYRLEDEELAQSGLPQDAIVLCRIFQKSGSGPKNGEQYGAPFIEEEWDDDNCTLTIPIGKPEEAGIGFSNIEPMEVKIPKIHPVAEPEMPDDSFPLHLQNVDNTVKDESLFSSQFCTNEQMFLECEDILDNATEEHQKFPTCENNNYVELNDLDSLDGVYDVKPSSQAINSSQLYYDPPVPDDSLPVDNGLFLELNDLANPIDNNLINQNEDSFTQFNWVDEYLTYFDSINDNLQEGSASSLLSSIDEPNDALNEHNSEGASSSKGKGEISSEGSGQEISIDSNAGGASLKRKSENSYGGIGERIPVDDKNVDVSDKQDDGYGHGWAKSLAKRLHGMVGTLPSPPAFAAEDPSKMKGKLVGQSDRPQLHTPIHVEAGIICLGDFPMNSATPMLKDGHVRGCLLTFESEIDNHKAVTSVVRKTGFYLFCWWVCFLAVSFKIGICVCAK